MRLCIVIVNYRSAELALDALSSLEGQVDPVTDQVLIVDNDSRDDSLRRIESAIAQRGFGAWCSLVRAPRNGGYAAGCNVGIRAADADYYLLMNSDTIARPGAVAALLAEMRAHPAVGIAAPRMEDADGTPQVSCFRDHTFLSELLAAARSRPLHPLLRRFEIRRPMSEEPMDTQWVSFACVLMRREVIVSVGLLDEHYFMYFEDSDYCRATREVGFRVRYFPSARVVRLRGPSAYTPASGGRAPRFYYASRARYFRKGYGLLGPLLANACWQWGRTLAFMFEVAGRKLPHTSEKAWLDNWVGALKP
jgi:N-acetylglucosaminyl-diphospho-decaprenol L-rhamnosyltransferase